MPTKVLILPCNKHGPNDAPQGSGGVGRATTIYPWRYTSADGESTILGSINNQGMSSAYARSGGITGQLLETIPTQPAIHFDIDSITVHPPYQESETGVFTEGSPELAQMAMLLNPDSELAQRLNELEVKGSSNGKNLGCIFATGIRLVNFLFAMVLLSGKFFLNLLKFIKVKGLFCN